IWAGFRPGYKGGLCRLSAARETLKIEKCYSPKDGLPSDWITDLYQTNEGRFWVATTRGLCEWQGAGKSSVCKTYTAKNDLCDTDVWDIFQDKDGNLWTGSQCGAKKISRFGFTDFTAADGLGSGTINSIFENPAGELFVTVTTDQGRIISRFNGENFTV